jgi:hypothetical protein
MPETDEMTEALAVGEEHVAHGLMAMGPDMYDFLAELAPPQRLLALTALQRYYGLPGDLLVLFLADPQRIADTLRDDPMAEALLLPLQIKAVMALDMDKLRYARDVLAPAAEETAEADHGTIVIDFGPDAKVTPPGEDEADAPQA